MTGRELAAFNFVDLSGEATAQNNNRDSFRHPLGSSTSLVKNRANAVDSSYFHVERRQYDPSDSLRQQISSSTRSQGLLRHHKENPAPVPKSPTQEIEMKDDPTNLLNGNHLTLACESSHQTGVEIDQAARKDDALEKRQFMLSLQEASQQQAIIQRRQAMNILAKLQATHEQASTRTTSQFNTDSPSRVPPGWMNPTSVKNHGVAANYMVDMMKATAVSGNCLNWTYQQQQCHSDIIQAPNSMSREPTSGPSTGCKHRRTAQMTVFYASMVNVYDDVPVEVAQAVCMMLMGYRSKWPPPATHDSAAPPSPLQSTPSPPPPPPPSPPQAPSTSKAGPSHSVQETGVALVSSARQPKPTPTPTPAGELPQARKVSLARFLDRRKDRVRSKERVRDESEPSRPSSTEKLLPTSRSSLSPITSVRRSTQSPSFFGALWHRRGVAPTASARKATSPTPPPPRQYTSQEQLDSTSKRITSDHETHEEALIHKKARSGSRFQNHESS